MKKSVYSLVLAEDVVEAIDRLAYERNTSRSNLINQILAEHVSLATPEMRMRDIFDSMEKMMTETFQLLSRSSDSMLSFRSPLRYKYNPTIRYSLELYRESSDGIGRLRISFRTQNRELISALHGFFQIWIPLENQVLDGVFPDGIRYEAEAGKYSRELHFPANLPACSGEDAGYAIASYIKMIDGAIKLYFANLDQTDGQRISLLRQFLLQYLSDPSAMII